MYSTYSQILRRKHVFIQRSIFRERKRIRERKRWIKVLQSIRINGTGILYIIFCKFFVWVLYYCNIKSIVLIKKKKHGCLGPTRRDSGWLHLGCGKLIQTHIWIYLLLWVIKSFVSGLGNLCLPAPCMTLWQVNLPVIIGQISDTWEFVTVLFSLCFLFIFISQFLKEVNNGSW